MGKLLREMSERIHSDQFYWKKRRSGTRAFRSAASPADQLEFGQMQLQERLMTKVFSKTR